MKTAIVFPGQGSQQVGMLADIAGQFPEVLETFSQASQVLGYDLWRLVQNGPAEELDKTAHTQPALLTAGYAIWQLMSSRAVPSAGPSVFIKPAFLAGHSLGEYTALVCANAMSFTDAVKLVAARGTFMQEAVAAGEGGLAAIIGLDLDAVTELCQQAIVNPEEVLAPANFNSPGQIVIAGHSVAIDRALVLAKTKGAKLAKRLPVSVPSHCRLMLPASEKLATVLHSLTIQTPSIPVISNVDVTLYRDPAEIRDGLIRQLYMPVRWQEIITEFAHQGITKIIECGPGKVLTGLNKRIADNLQVVHTGDLTSLQELLNG